MEDGSAVNGGSVTGVEEEEGPVVDTVFDQEKEGRKEEEDVREEQNVNLVTEKRVEQVKDEINVDTLKRLIDSHLRKNNIYGEIRRFVNEFGNQEGKDVFDTIKEKDIIHKVIDSLGSQKDDVLKTNKHVEEGSSVDPGKQYLLVKIVGGHAFAIDSDPKKSMYKICLHYGDQRFESAAVEGSEDPSFDASFLVRLSDRFSLAGKGAGNFETQVKGMRRLLLSGRDDVKNDGKSHEDRGELNMLHIVIIRILEDDNSREIVASHMLEWRKILCKNGGASVVVELRGIGPTAKVRIPVGMLDLRLDLVPSVVGDTSVLLSERDVDMTLETESRAIARSHRRFCEYARVWWKEYIETNQSFRGRCVKIFVENEWGEHVPACTMVRPLRAGRLLDSPRHAARFVSLLPYIHEESVGGGRLEIWHTVHSILCRRQGDVEDHALLLCSFLLGFGLDAYVCIGLIDDDENPGGEKEHVWVVSLSGKANRQVLFWESLTGQTLDRQTLVGRDGAKPNCPYRRVDCVFNHRTFYANKQLKESRVSGCNFNFADDLQWKAMDERLIQSLSWNRSCPLRESRLDVFEVAARIENELKGLIESERAEQHGLSTSWDEDLGYYLSPALSAYESERCTGVLSGNKEFQAVIKRHIPQGHSFKGYPTMFNHLNACKMLHSFRLNPVPKDIIQTRADHCHLALRVRVFAFPDSIYAVWVMFAVRYRGS
uniref:CEP76 C2 domain-containing protein n=1 Tax=Mucochytrium quahogii TaxID=96639 RepID=A0A7S2S781_9STRA|mmetsp:Transcript_41352/g.66421  ORF Transcript_41352/g.66421 Transcript_41352/m.66421 type:complete len:713 (-) Transcript_41352:480-2618(-)|eukprot:CAMPEP_0203761028 /NCGR_PEP_ID=MMETSP0098-20131031/14197_1 /ASSEMBLY_ACC=CAM_ASM_000208 /TAXON_ID=96639 /ORGANISM=" , Strain NY0313808BC1" /LENGTH=712 /DNA_ID=CAMNT_0050654837 /DNA_START=116 /DNA_END=2254 /DNA_ORIENTATION=+